MSANPIAGLLQVISGGSRKGDGSDASGENGFAGFIQAFVRPESKPESRGEVSIGKEPVLEDRSPEDIAVGRVAALVHSGVLNRKELESLEAEEYEDLENWVLAGADGLFPPIHIPADLSNGLAAGMDQEQLTALLDWLAGGDAGSLAQKVEAIAALMQGEKDGSAMLGSLWENLGLDFSDSDSLKNLQATLSEALGEEGPSALTEMNQKELAALLAQAMEEAGVGEKTEIDTLAKMPEAVLRSMGVNVLEIEDDGALPAGGLLEQLASGVSVREKMAQLQEAPEVEAKDVEAKIAARQTTDPQGAMNSFSDEAGEEQPQEDPADGMLTQMAESTTETTSSADLVGEEADVVNPTTPSTGSNPLSAPAQPLPVDVTPQQMNENIERIEQVMRLSVRRNMQRVSLQLSPPQLGRITMRIEVRNGAMSAVIQTENADARNLLSQGIEQLRQSLQVQGIQLEQFDVNLEEREMAEGRDGRWPSGRRSSSGGNKGEVGEGEALVATEETDHSPGSTGSPVWTSDSVNVIA